MKFTLLLTVGTLFTAAAASAPNPSSTRININSAPQPAISKSRVSSTLDARAPYTSIIANRAVLQYRSDAIHEASTDAVKARSAMSGMGRKARIHLRSKLTPSKARLQSSDTQKHSQHLTTANKKEVRVRKSSMGKARRQRKQSTKQQRRTLRFLPSRK
ncbi:hypothetical protein N0V95_005571 [Ascochyta clinopodiicola]|nr:hypothetical protein N0V95_005571 [Ascochyta clinopodiicola]